MSNQLCRKCDHLEMWPHHNSADARFSHTFVPPEEGTYRPETKPLENSQDSSAPQSPKSNEEAPPAFGAGTQQDSMSSTDQAALLRRAEGWLGVMLDALRSATEGDKLNFKRFQRETNVLRCALMKEADAQAAQSLSASHTVKTPQAPSSDYAALLAEALQLMQEHCDNHDGRDDFGLCCGNCDGAIPVAHSFGCRARSALKAAAGAA